MKIAQLQFDPLLLDSHCLIDVRTPLEFEEDHIPGAHNVPLLSNEERVEIGTIHKEVGPVAARRRGLELTCGRLYQIVDDILAQAAGRPVLVYCWRGGLRSKSVVMLLQTCAVSAYQLIGGYKAYRAHVNQFFDQCEFSAPLIVMHGMTGVGKTQFILGLDRSKWGVIDLEGLACHRGSAFGAFGLEQKISQKRFETLLWDEFRKQSISRPIVLEGESRRIGKYLLPGNLYQKMAASCKIWCFASVETRIKRLSVEYAKLEYQKKMLDALERIRKKLGGQQVAELQKAIEDWDTEAVARGLIDGYYDKMYYSTRAWTPELELDFEDLALAESALDDYWFHRRIVT